jgi:hypothetical protein
MQTLTHTIRLPYIRCKDHLISTLEKLFIKCSVIEETITSITLQLEIDDSLTLNDVLSIGTLIGSIETSSLI